MCGRVVRAGLSMLLLMCALGCGKVDKCPVGAEHCPCTLSFACAPGLKCVLDTCVSSPAADSAPGDTRVDTRDTSVVTDSVVTVDKSVVTVDKTGVTGDKRTAE
jgi:hypothetical protein